MDEEIERLVVSVRADTTGFARDVAAMKAQLDGPLQTGAARAGRGIEDALAAAVRRGKLGFEDLGRVAAQALADIAATAVRSGLGAILSGLGGVLGGARGLLGGLPGRATGGGVVGGRAYLVGERGPELFVPTAAGQVAPLTPPRTSARDVTVNIRLTAPVGSDPAQALSRSSRQVARAVRRALD
jgi:phage-related minor tail protein